MITKQGYEQLFVLRDQTEVYEREMIPRAREVARELYGPDLWKFTFTKEWVYVFLGEEDDDPNSFAAALMWDPAYKKTIADHKAAVEKRIKERAEASAMVEAKRVEQAERAELARLRAKYPGA